MKFTVSRASAAAESISGRVLPNLKINNGKMIRDIFCQKCIFPKEQAKDRGLVCSDSNAAHIYKGATASGTCGKMRSCSY